MLANNQMSRRHRPVSAEGLGHDLIDEEIEVLGPNPAIPKDPLHGRADFTVTVETNG
jgi:hypothetical protein